MKRGLHRVIKRVYHRVPQVSLLRLGRLCPRGVPALISFGLWLLLGTSCVALVQSVPAAQKKNQQTQPAPTSTYGKTIFSRSDASTPDAVESPTSPQAAKQQVSAQPPLVSDTERTALTYSSYNLEVHLEPARHAISMRAHLTAQNTSDKPLHRIALQLSSSLHWYSIHADGSTAKFQTEAVESDIDHTGQLTEAVIPLSAPLAAGATIQLDVIYSGTVQESAERLLRLGAPAKIAASSEWDSIAPEFTALRGFGNVIWFPVSTAPVLLGQGSQMFDSVGKWKLRESGARVQMHVLVEYLRAKPNIAFLNGHVVQPDSSAPEKNANSAANTSAAPPPNAIPRVASFTLSPTTLGFSPLSFFVMDASPQHFSGLDIYTRPGNETAAAAYEKIVENDRPLVEQWLGTHPKRPVVLVDLPNSDDLPFEERNILLLPLQANAANDTLAPVLAHMLSHAYFVSPRPWLNEGVAQLITLLWIEQRAGRATAITQMESHRAALALAETSDPGVDPGRSLINAWSDIYYRDKAVYVLWMLRDIAGDTSFATTLQAYNPANDKEASYFQSLLRKASGTDLEWLFDDWVYRDRGLPDLHIASAYRRPILTKNSAARNYLVSIDVQNDGFCSAEVSVTVESTTTNQTKRLLVPSHTRAALRVLLDSQPSRVIVNDGSVPEVQASQHEEKIEAAQ